MAEQLWRDAAAEIWQLFKETDVKFKETDVKFKETDARLDKLFRETQAQFKETDRKINRLEGIFRSQWAQLVESLVQPNALNLFQQCGIQVHYVYQRIKSQFNGHLMELDLVLENSHEVIVIEAKSTLWVSDVRDFLDDLDEFLNFFLRYQGYKLYGAVAGLNIVEEADRFAYRRGLFVLDVVGDGIARIKNDIDFQPRDFSAAL